jgi:hypothetical protein
VLTNVTSKSTRRSPRSAASDRPRIEEEGAAHVLTSDCLGSLDSSVPWASPRGSKTVSVPLRSWPLPGHPMPETIICRLKRSAIFSRSEHEIFFTLPGISSAQIESSRSCISRPTNHRIGGIRGWFAAESARDVRCGPQLFMCAGAHLCLRKRSTFTQAAGKPIRGDAL